MHSSVTGAAGSADATGELWLFCSPTTPSCDGSSFTGTTNKGEETYGQST
jgi:hypothetical protein